MLNLGVFKKSGVYLKLYLREYIVILIIIIFFGSFNFQYIFKNGFGESDSYRIHAGLIHGMLTNKELSSEHLFGIKYHFGYYFLVFKIYPLLKLPLQKLSFFLNFSNFLIHLSLTRAETAFINTKLITILLIISLK